MNDKDGGYVVPEFFMEQINDNLLRKFPFRPTLPPSPPLTLRGRLRIAWYDFRWGVHNRLFPDCRADEYDD